MTRTSVVVGLAVVWMGSAVSAQAPGRVHALNASPSTTPIFCFDFFFDASLEPVLRVDPGAVVRPLPRRES